MATSVTNNRPSIPPITIESAVINWFLNHDEHLNGLRANFPDQVAAVAADIQAVLNETPDGKSLHATVTKIGEFFTDYTPQEVALYQRGAPFSDDEWRFLFTCELAGAKMRILGYFLEKKYGIDPSDSPSLLIDCPSCGQKNSTPRTAKRIRCGSCRQEIVLDGSSPEPNQPSPRIRGSDRNVRSKQLALAIAIVAAGMLVYAPWSHCIGGPSTSSCYEQQVSNAASEYAVAPNYWFFWEVPPDWVVTPGANPFLDKYLGGADQPYGVGWAMDLHRLSRQFAALLFVGAVAWWILVGLRR